MLPAEFADLEPYLAQRWESETDRFALRLEAPTAEKRPFYDPITAQAGEAIAYHGRYPIDGKQQAAVNQLYMLSPIVKVSSAVERRSRGRLPDSGATALDRHVQPVR